MPWGGESGRRHAPRWVRPRTAAQRESVRPGWHAAAACTVRHDPIRRARAADPAPPPSARDRDATAPAVQHALPAGDRDGWACGHTKSSRPRSTRPCRDERHADARHAVRPHRPPRSASRPAWGPGTCGPRSATTAAARPASGAPRRSVSPGHVGAAAGGTPSTREHPSRSRRHANKTARDRWLRLAPTPAAGVRGCPEETWGGRRTLPTTPAGAGAEPLRWVERATPRTDPDPTTLGGYGWRRGDTGPRRRRWVHGRPGPSGDRGLPRWGVRTVGGRRYAGVGAGRGYRLRAEQRSGGRRDRATQRPGVGCGRRAYPGVSAAGPGSGAPFP